MWTIETCRDLLLEMEDLISAPVSYAGLIGAVEAILKSTMPPTERADSALNMIHAFRQLREKAVAADETPPPAA